MPPSGDWITVEEAGGILGLSPATIRRKCAAGELQAHKVGRSWVIDRKSLPRPVVRTPPRRSGTVSSYVDLEQAILHVAQKDLREDTWVPDILLYEDDLSDRDILMQAAADRIDGHAVHDPPLEVPVPKSPFFHRNAISLSLVDRLAFHAVVASFVDTIEKTLSHSVYSARVSKWKSRFLEKGTSGWLRWRHGVIDELKKGNEYMVSTDVTAYFDFVKHEILIPELQQLGVEKGLIPPLRRMLKEWTSTPNTGIPQGPDASRVLGNFYMVAVDQVMDDFPGVKYFRYLDDMRIVGPSRSGVIDALQVLDQECRRRGLALSAQKTELLVGKRAVAAMSDSQLDAVHYAFQHATEDGSELRKRLVSIFKKALKRDGTVNTRWARFSLWRLYQLRADSVLSRVLGSLERLAPLGLLVVQYLHPWLRRPVVQRKITKYLNDAERNTSPYLSCWLMAAMLDIPDAIPPEWITYARSVALDRAAPTYHRTIALNVLALGQQARDLTSLREVARREYDPEVVRAALVALKRAGAPTKEIVHLAGRIPALEPTGAYLRERNDLPSLVFRARSHRNRLKGTQP